jgi:hypothetical protein
MTAWTIDSGASARAATWKAHAPTATTMPMANHFERKSPTALATGCFRLTSGAAQAPLCLSRKPTFVANAQKRARRIPIESKVI